MAFNLSTTGIADGSQLFASHVTQSIDALKGTHAYNLNPSGTFALTGSFITSGSVNVSGSVTISGSTHITGSTNITGSIKIIGSTNYTGSLNITGSIQTSGSISVSGSLNVSGSTFITGSLNVDALTGSAIIFSQGWISSSNFTDDDAAFAGGIPIGGVYHNAGALRVRLYVIP